MSCTDLDWSYSFRYTKGNSHLVPQLGGIYKVLRNDGREGELTRIYVGKAVDLRAQYFAHLSSQEENICLKNNIRDNECYFKYALLFYEVNRQNAERHLLETGKYKCNKQGQ